jgi:hypothetical protein
MSVGYEHLFRFPPYSNSWRAMTGDWPDDPWFDHNPLRPTWRERRAHARQLKARGDVARPAVVVSNDVLVAPSVRRTSSAVVTDQPSEASFEVGCGAQR